MIFDRLDLEDAEGAFLAHAVEAGECGILKKGTVLTKEHLEAIKAAGEQTVLAARLEDDDVDENDAAYKIAVISAGAEVDVRPPFTGRSNITSKSDGVVEINSKLLKKINKIDPSITIATVNNMDMVTSGQMLATIKIIPFSTKQKFLDKAEKKAKKKKTPLIQVHPFKKKKIGLISTLLPNTPDKLITKSTVVLENRLEACGNHLWRTATCSHHEDDLGTEINSLVRDGAEIILIFGASAITDERDVIPTAIKNSGGDVEHFGMPVDPGNLLLLGKIGDTTVVGMPGCTRSPKLNGFDWVLQRLLAEIPVKAKDIMRMGEGGLLKEIPGRPQPRGKQLPETEKEKPKIAALILAAGQSRRMGPENKLLALIDDKPILRHVAENLANTGVEQISMVTGHEADQIKSLVWDMPIQMIENPDYAEGLSTSLKAGMKALQDKYEGIIVCLGDMPFVTPDQFQQMIDAFDPVEGRAIIVPTFKGKRGNPVLLSSQFADEVEKISGDMGAKAIISENDHLVHGVEFDSDAIFTDIDTPQMLKAALDKKS
ncbi:NTP transferase domain-containing protein [Sneathiella sp. P13V-1]|uniref:NTP transferase domain-containing protein n=1 Tax=Sneathiella sp. P13V-1 TaxID=2697366 RepID=UPI00187BA235|nr:molybdopterin-binding/glycosyltransferase family 2 protein [Sneathiella sp. P13V-1]MBE7637422.1 NTP transferase domain-containing protein [Sneathiella sp. P13V-1]